MDNQSVARDNACQLFAHKYGVFPEVANYIHDRGFGLDSHLVSVQGSGSGSNISQALAWFTENGYQDSIDFVYIRLQHDPYLLGFFFKDPELAIMVKLMYGY